MKTLINLLLAFSLVFAFSCKSREKQVQKSETQTETKSEASAKIEEKTFEIIFDKSVLKNDFSYKNSSEETSKNEKKNVDKGKEYYENGNLKKEWERDLSELSESTKKTFTELEERIVKEQEVSKYWEDSSNHFYQLLEQEKKKNYTKNLSVKSEAKKSFLFGLYVAFWYIVFAVFFGWLIMPVIWRFIYSWVKRFQPYIALVEFLNKKIK